MEKFNGFAIAENFHFIFKTIRFTAILEPCLTFIRLDIIQLAQVMSTLYITYFLYALVVYGGIVRIFGKYSPLRFFKNVAPAALNAFSTCSSNATLPLSMKCATEEIGVSEEVAAFAALAPVAGIPVQQILGVYISVNTLADMGATCVNVLGDLAVATVLRQTFRSEATVSEKNIDKSLVQ